jgi:hypothetical protein
VVNRRSFRRVAEQRNGEAMMGGDLSEKVHCLIRHHAKERTKKGQRMNDLDTVLAYQEISKCKARYCFACDTKNWDLYGSVFTEDAEMDLRGYTLALHPITGSWVRAGSDLDFEYLKEVEDLVKWPVVGRRAIVAMVREMADSMTSFHKLFTPIIDVTSDRTAKAIWPMEDVLHYAAGGKISFLNGMGHYHETYENVRGNWLLKTVSISRILITIR